VDGDGASPIFKSDRNFPVTIENMTLEHGGGNGAAVLAEPTGDETVTLEDVLVKGLGGSEDEADALLRATSGGLVVEDSTVENFAGFGVAGDGGEISVEDSTIARAGLARLQRRTDPNSGHLEHQRRA
jgi:uncharacterized protein GlcG (DUF336 family)